MNPYFRITLALTVITLLAFFGCSNNNSKSPENLSAEDIASYQKIGSTYAASTQKVLGSNLVSAIEDGGTVNALEFCNIKALPLTDSMAVELNTYIKRVSDQPRNPLNKADKAEHAYIKKTKEQLVLGEEVRPLIQAKNGRITGYYPIITNQLCMQCHGSEGSQIGDATLSKIKELYPDDKATGYSVGELRGIWVVEMEQDTAITSE